MILPLALVVAGAGGAPEVERRIRLDPEVEAIPTAWVVGRVAPERFAALIEEARAGGGLVLVLSRDAPDPAPLGLTIEGREADPATVRGACEAARAGESWCGAIPWESAPPAGERARVRPGPAWRVLAEAGGDPLLLARDLGRGRVYALAAAGAGSAADRLALWPYYGYLLRALTGAAAGRPVPAFADWSQAPVPQRGAAAAMAATVAILWIVTLALFRLARRAARARPAPAADLFPAAPPAGARAGWARVGFARPLSGLLTLAGAVVVLLAPYLWLTSVVIPNRVQPFPEAKGMWEWTWEVLQVVRFLFDAGTFVAFVKYFAEYRVKDPAEALRCARFFVWWQVLTGLVQLTVAVAAAASVLLHTRYAYLSWLVVLNGVVEYPGIFGLFTFFFMAVQRYDLNVGLDLLSDYVLRHGIAIPLVLAGRAWGRGDPAVGEMVGAAVGLGLGYAAANLGVFALGLAFYRRMGLRLGPLLSADFTAGTARRMLGYGFRLVLGQGFYRAAHSIEQTTVSLLLPNYPFWIGIRGQIHYQLGFLFPVAYRAFETATAALSEAHGSGKRALVRYYVARFFQLGTLWSATVAALLLALGPAFVRGAMAPQWHAIVGLLAIAVASSVPSPWAWLSDMLQKAAGRPGLFSWVLACEQTLRIGLLLLLVPLFGMHGLYAAVLAAVLLKCLAGWWLNHRLIERLTLPVWPVFLAPALAGLIHYAALCGLGAAFPDLSPLATKALFFAAGIGSLVAMWFWCGLCGAFDAGFLEELRDAAGLARAVRPFGLAVLAAARAGAALSPVPTWGRMPMRAEAEREARELEGGV